MIPPVLMPSRVGGNAVKYCPGDPEDPFLNASAFVRGRFLILLYGGISVKKLLFLVMVIFCAAATTASAGMWHVDSKGQLRELGGGTDPIRTPPSGCGQIYDVKQNGKDIFVYTEKGIYKKLPGTWRKIN